ncbi:hypothetical protein CEE45_09470 [Candidatus Heimdallarchaeota archaeon B3_Heim]|nr:MAG: hypothetical protein CEE45_09470 [Candidatus Heimdallarchaeota archaeon B3_Heim]
MQILEHGFCPFRVEKSNFHAGCVLRRGQTTLCYTQDVRPLLRRVTAPDEYYCPLINFSIDNNTYNEFEQVLSPLLQIQDEQNTAINIWPMLKGWANPKHEVTSPEGRMLVQLSAQIKEALENIVYDLN